MSRFDNYFLMGVNDDRVRWRNANIAWNRDAMQAREIGDGNLNYVFRVWDDKAFRHRKARGRRCASPRK